MRREEAARAAQSAAEQALHLERARVGEALGVAHARAEEAEATAAEAMVRPDEP